MPTVQHEFTNKILQIINNYFPSQGSRVLKSSELLQYLNIKTKAANRGSKSRGGFANHYAITTRVVAPFLVVVEAKCGIEGSDSIPQLYGEMLAAARLNWQLNQQEPQVIFGCYTIADTWTFVKGEVAQVDTDRPILSIEYSHEYTQKYDIVTILKLIKSIVQQYPQF